MKKAVIALGVICALFTTGCTKETKNGIHVKTVGGEIVEVIEVETIEVEGIHVETIIS